LQVVISTSRWTLSEQTNRLRLYSPASRLRGERQRLDELERSLVWITDHRFQLSRARLGGVEQRLSALNPASVLARGYAIVSQREGSVVRSVRQVGSGDAIDVRVSDGSFAARVDGG
jgi:exodeoxyribonuclease VII large subunit